MHNSTDYRRFPYRHIQTESCSPSVFEDDNNDARKDPASSQLKRTGKADPSDNKSTPLVQTTLSSLFKKVEGKVMFLIFPVKHHFPMSYVTIK